MQHKFSINYNHSNDKSYGTAKYHAVNASKRQ